MKKFVSMAMVAAMTTSMVPATAFAGIGEVEATAKIVDAWKMTEDFDGVVTGGADSVPELQIKITDTNYKNTATEDYYAEITVALDNADLAPGFSTANIGVRLDRSAENQIENDLANTAQNVSTLETKAVNAATAIDGGAWTTGNIDAPENMTWADTGALTLAEKNAKTAYDNATPTDPATAAAKTAYDDAVAATEAAEDAVAAQKGAIATATATVTSTKAASDAKEQAYQTAAAAWKTAKDAYEASYATTQNDQDATTKPLKQTMIDKEVLMINAKVDWEGGQKVIEDPGDSDGFTIIDDTGNTVPVATAPKTAYDDAVKAVEDLNTDLATLEAAVTTAENAEAAAKTVYDNAVANDSSVAALKTAYDNAAKAVKDAKDDYEDAWNALQDAKDVAANGSSVTSEDLFEIVPVEGISKAKSTKSIDEFTFGIKGELHEGDVIYVDLETIMDKTSIGKQATLDVESDDLNLDVADLVYVAVEDYGITATVKKLAKVAEEEKEELEKDLKIESVVGDFAVGQEIELKLSNGFEFDALADGDAYKVVEVDDDEATIEVTKAVDEITIKADDMTIEATKAKSGAVATLTVKAKETKGIKGAFAATAKVEVMEVVDYTVMMSVDEDEDIPVIYSGTNVDNYGITDDSDHLSLEVTIEESFPGAWSMRKGFNLELPDGVYVTDVNVTETEGLLKNNDAQGTADVKAAFYNAYQDGDHKGFEFEKRVFDDVNNDLEDDCATMSFELELVADPTFVGDVTLKLTGDLVDEQEVTVATFMPIAVVEAEQNDMKIDYRYTEIPTEIKVTETAAGLWEEGSEFWVAVDKDDYIEFEDDATFEVTGGMEIDDFTGEDRPNWDGDDVASLGFAVDEESDEAATITISNMSLFMQRNIPAGAYDLTAGSTVFGAYQVEKLFAPDCDADGCDGDCSDKNNDCIIDDIADFSEVVKEAFVNVVTAGREQDDASFTTKVVVPVGESYIVAGENQVALDVPAYVSAAGYTMLPVRAVATALGINNNNVIWNGETKTVTILYGQRIITMVAGQKTVNVNGSVIPASAAVEIVDGRTFLPMRDLATALGVTDITWDAATKTATLNGGVVAE